MKREVHQPLGVTVTELSILDVDAQTILQLKLLLAEHGVIVLPDQDVDDDGFVAFLRRFGELTFTTGETPVAGFADLNIITNVGRSATPRSTFHTDSSYLRRPPAYTALRAVTIPESGGETVFSNQYRALDTLPPETSADLEARTITHVVTGLELGADDEQAAEHPVLRRHPISGRTALFLSTPRRCAAVSGLSAIAADALVHRLYEHSIRPDNTYRHRWRPGDVVMWDNGCTLHRADHSAVVGDRVMHRGMVAAY